MVPLLRRPLDGDQPVAGSVRQRESLELRSARHEEPPQQIVVDGLSSTQPGGGHAASVNRPEGYVDVVPGELTAFVAIVVANHYQAIVNRRIKGPGKLGSAHHE